MSPSLAELQTMLFRLIVAPECVERALASEGTVSRSLVNTLIRGDAKLSAIARVEIYANMYFYRLLDAIKEDFPGTLSVLGEANFHNLITGYLIEYPPTQPSITEASRHLSAFAQHAQWAEKFPFLSDLIRLERALVEAFLGANASPLRGDELRAVSLSEWPALRFGLHPAGQLLDCEWRVDEMLSAIEQGKAIPLPVRQSRSILVWRNKWVTKYRPLGEMERVALNTIRYGQSFEDACEEITSRNREMTPCRLSEMLLRWLVDGILISAQVCGKASANGHDWR